jgi:phage pi2 protein 07
MITHRDIELVGYVKPSEQHFYENKARDLWWPFWAWKVIAPKEANETDIFRELILKLINAGCNDAKTIADLSGLHKDFVLHLVAILQGGKMLDGWQLTDHGRTTLEKGFDLSTELKSYFVLQDAGSGEVLPRVFSHFDYIDDIEIADKRVSYVMNRGTGKKRSPFMIREFGGVPSRPSVDKIYDAIRQHRKDRNKLKQAGFDADAVELLEGAVDYLDDTPTAIYMNLKVFIDMSGDRSWYVSDPGGLFPSLPILNSVADKRFESDKFFASRIDELLGIAAEDKELNYLVRNDILEEKIKAQLISDYAWASRVPLAEEYVLRMLRDHYDYLECQVKPSWKVERLSISLQNVCESIVKLLLNPDMEKKEFNKIEFCGKSISKQQIKFIYLNSCKSIDDELARYFSGIQWWVLKDAMQTGKRSLRQLMAALVLVSPEVVDEVDMECPGWLHSLKDVAENRNASAGHANDVVLDIDRVNKDFEFVDKLLKVIERKC